MLYRARQFWQAISAAPKAQDLELASRWLEPSLLALFLRLQPSEQAHSLSILRQLSEQGESEPDLMAGALLHDVGKVCCPLSVWERIIIVLGRAIFPSLVKKWGRGEPRGWRRPFVVAERHAVWGAELAAQAGASARTVRLIRCHQEIPAPSAEVESAYSSSFSQEERWLRRLYTLDNQN